MPKVSIERFNRKRVLLLIVKNIERKKFHTLEKIVILQKIVCVCVFVCMWVGGGGGHHGAVAHA